MTERPRARTAVIPAAGLGTRFLPATKAIPKEMLPVVDTPAIEFVVAEAARAGLDDVLLITSRAKKAIEDHFDAAPEIEQALEKKGDAAMLGRVQRSSSLAHVHAVRQGEPRGLGHAVLCGADHVGDRPFAVMLGDDLVDHRDELLERMLDVQQREGGSVVALMRVPRDQVHLYGCVAAEPVADDGHEYPVVRITDMVEKPPAGTEPSDLIIVGRYVLSAGIFDILRSTDPGRGGEIQLTDAMKAQMATEPMHGVVFTGRRYDTGDRQEYLRTVVRLALEREDLGPPFAAWLKDLSAGL
ncbi:MAG TPA: UTP--glucose-1-phosphate uridylyltransferase [Mycobacteriales bacterium]|nr:UTP--glucose-1-phosphate uridylyltransferase [Mycobacteriales bacterium]